MVQAILVGGSMWRSAELHEQILHAMANMTKIARMPSVSSDEGIDD